ncbi:MAG: tryptophan synthase subunit alpha [Candidatus Parcubacteria bacterium]|nr:tryptophan synthase subunit alpha [Burkholderiales bacterium]
MSRIAGRFAALKAAGRKALIPYVTAGDPQASSTVPLLHGMVEAGSDILEIGVPFSDPMADGPAIQRSSERALRNGIGLSDVLGFVKNFREKDNLTPVVLMGYANPIEAMGIEKFVSAAAAAGVDGVIVVDYPPQECEPFAQLCGEAGIDCIFLLAPTSTDARIREVARAGTGYLYYVSLKGVTGVKSADAGDIAAQLPRLRAASSLPIGVGFGIKDAETARAISKFSDAVIIGSRIVEEIENAGPVHAVARVKALLIPIRKALDA